MITLMLGLKVIDSKDKNFTLTRKIVSLTMLGMIDMITLIAFNL
jgi:hypothetical protein